MYKRKNIFVVTWAKTSSIKQVVKNENAKRSPAAKTNFYVSFEWDVDGAF